MCETTSCRSGRSGHQHQHTPSPCWWDLAEAGLGLCHAGSHWEPNTSAWGCCPFLQPPSARGNWEVPVLEKCSGMAQPCFASQWRQGPVRLSWPHFLQRWCWCDGVPPLLSAHCSQECPGSHDSVKLQKLLQIMTKEIRGWPISSDDQLPVWWFSWDSPHPDISPIVAIWGLGLPQC